MNVRILCTTDDPVDSLEHHQKIKNEGFEIKILPAFRPDKAMQVDDAVIFNQYVGRVEAAANASISSYDDYLAALKKRHDYFAAMGCSVSDHGLEHLYAEHFSENEIRSVFSRIRSGNQLTPEESRKIKSALIIQFAL